LAALFGPELRIVGGEGVGQVCGVRVNVGGLAEHPAYLFDYHIHVGLAVFYFHFFRHPEVDAAAVAVLKSHSVGEHVCELFARGLCYQVHPFATLRLHSENVGFGLVPFDELDCEGVLVHRKVLAAVYRDDVVYSVFARLLLRFPRVEVAL